VEKLFVYGSLTRGKRFNPLLYNWGATFITRGCVWNMDLYRQGDFHLIKPGASRVFGELWVVPPEVIMGVDRLSGGEQGGFMREEVGFTSFGHRDSTEFPVTAYVWKRAVVPSGCLYVGSGA